MWTWQQYGSKDDAVRKSDLMTFAACGRRFRYSKEERTGVEQDGKRVFGVALAGTATHGALERALPFVLKHGKIDQVHLRAAYFEEYEKALKREGATNNDVVWPRKTNSELEHKRKIWELYYFLLSAPKKIAKVLGVEQTFRYPIQAAQEEIWVTGTIDIIFEATNGAFCVGDYKSGKRKPNQFAIDYGFELGIYAHAAAEGEFKGKADEASIRYGKFPDELYLISVGDFLPAQKDSKKHVWSHEECEFWGVKPGGLVQVKKGMQKGPGWYRSSRTAKQLPGLSHAIGEVVKAVRAGHFIPVLNETCSPCRFRNLCLSEGFGVEMTDGDRAALEAAIAAAETETAEGEA